MVADDSPEIFSRIFLQELQAEPSSPSSAIFSDAIGTGIAGLAVTNVQAGDESSMSFGYCYVSRSVEVEGPIGKVTFVRYKGRKGKTQSTATPYFAPDLLARVMRRASIYPDSNKGDSPIVSEEDLRECASKVDSFRRSVAWKVVMEGTAQEGNIHAHGADTFVKDGLRAKEIEISAIFECVLSAKGMPPFVPRMYGFRNVRPPLSHTNFRTPSSECFSVCLEKLKGVTLHQHLNDCFDQNRDPRLSAILTQVCIALRTLQKYAGAVHNDLHSENIMVQTKGDGDRMVIRSEGQIFSFGVDDPVIKLIDFGQAGVVHPVRSEVVATVYTAHMMRDVHCADTAKLMICLVKWAANKAHRSFGDPHHWPRILGKLVTEDVFRALEHLHLSKPTVASVLAYASSPNENTEYFPCDVGASASALLKTGACAAEFIVVLPDGCAPISLEGTTRWASNNFFEREGDVWCDREAIERYRAIEDASERLVLERIVLPRRNIFQIEGVLKRVLRGVTPYLGDKGVLKNVPGNSDRRTVVLRSIKGKPYTLHMQQTDSFLCKRVAWRILILFQQGILLYLKLFFAKNQTDEILDLTSSMAVLSAKLSFDESVDSAARGELTHVRYLMLSLIAMTDDYEPFFQSHEVHNAFGISGSKKGDANRAVFCEMRKVMTKAYNSARFRSDRGSLGLCVDASMLRHADIYGRLSNSEGDVMPYMFGLSSDPLFYGVVS